MSFTVGVRCLHFWQFVGETGLFTMGVKMFSDREVTYRRTLHVSVRLACREQTCDVCQKLIVPGEEYEEEVVALRTRFSDGRIERHVSVWRRHAHGCLPPDKDFDQDRDLDEDAPFVEAA